MVSLHLLGPQRQGALFWTPALMVHTGVRRGRLATGQNRQCSHPDELRPGGRCDVIVLVHHWDVAKTSASIAQVGSPRPTETRELSKLRSTHLGCFSGRREAVCRGAASTGLEEDRSIFKMGLLIWWEELGLIH